MKKTPLCIFLTLTVLFTLFFYYREKSLSSGFSVDTVTAERETLRDYVTLRGRISEKERRNLYLPCFATVCDSFASEGETVLEGDLLMTVKRTDGFVSAAALTESVKDMIAATFYESAASTDALADTEERNGIMYVYSPCGGTVMNIVSKKDSVISQGTPCAVISDVGRLEVVTYAEENLIGDIKKGCECTVRVRSLTDKEYEGRVTKIMPYAKASILSGKNSAETEIRISLPKSEILKPGYTAVVNIVTDVRENALTVPFEAVGEDEENREYVLSLSNGKGEKKYIETGKELYDKFEVLSGITPEDRLILYPDSVPKEYILEK
ncbi:MAG: efflux RND transporter periplasmic adaptor subunit [Clostridia bacterium]|nr:efflux RND transporter periplasmic adaptor subunit [Clostridia bacterium]